MLLTTMLCTVRHQQPFLEDESNALPTHRRPQKRSYSQTMPRDDDDDDDRRVPEVSLGAAAPKVARRLLPTLPDFGPVPLLKLPGTALQPTVGSRALGLVNNTMFNAGYVYVPKYEPVQLTFTVQAVLPSGDLVVRMLTRGGVWSAFTRTVKRTDSGTARIVNNFHPHEIRATDCVQVPHTPVMHLLIRGPMELAELRERLKTSEPQTGTLIMAPGDRTTRATTTQQVRNRFDKLCLRCQRIAEHCGMTMFAEALQDFGRLLTHAEMLVANADEDDGCIQMILEWFNKQYSDSESEDVVLSYRWRLVYQVFRLSDATELVAPTLEHSAGMQQMPDAPDPVSNMVHSALATCSLEEMHRLPTIVQQFALLIRVFDEGPVTFHDVLAKSLGGK